MKVLNDHYGHLLFGVSASSIASERTPSELGRAFAKKENNLLTLIMLAIRIFQNLQHCFFVCSMY